MAASTAASDTAQEILDVAERLVQTHGFNGFSYADIADAVGVTKASLHYHFATKAELGRSLVARYHERFFAALADGRAFDAPAKLRRYVQLYANVLKDDRMCLCGMLAADFATLPRAMKGAVQRFFDENERWLADVLEQGLKSNQLQFKAPAIDVARMFIGALEGAMLVARSYGDPPRFAAAANWLLAQLGAAERSKAKTRRR